MNALEIVDRLVHIARSLARSKTLQDAPRRANGPARPPGIAQLSEGVAHMKLDSAACVTLAPSQHLNS